MDNKDKIIDYFFHHKVSRPLRERVFSLLLRHQADDGQDAALRKLWDESGNEAVDQGEMATRWNATKQAAGLSSVPPRLEVVKKRRLKLYLYAASLLLPLLSIGFAAYWYKESQRQMEMLAQVKMLQVSTDYGQKRVVVLPDSSKVWLNAGSVLVYPSSFLSSERKVFLSGEGYFQVTKNHKPFLVSTNYLQMKVLGTTFNVRSYTGAPQVSVTLHTGKLQVSVLNSSTIDPCVLTPNHRFVYKPFTGEGKMSAVATGSELQWRDNVLVIPNLTLSETLEEIERTYNVKCHLLTPRYGSQRLRAHFNKDEHLDTVLEVIKVLIPGISYEIVGKDVYLK